MRTFIQKHFIKIDNINYNYINDELAKRELTNVQHS